VQAVAKHTNFTDVLRELGLRPAGGNHASMKRHAARLSLDTSHFNSERRVRGLSVARELQRRSLAETFCEGSTVSRPALRSQARLLISPFCCAICGNAGEWQGRSLTLQLDHVNGRHDDNRLENLRWLCPNCHSQTPNFAGRGKSRRVREAPAFYAARFRRPAPRRSIAPRC
jgi:5-methylcytosine-specific restriction endonuclease McrA